MTRALLFIFLALLPITAGAQGPAFRWATQIGGSTPSDFSFGQGLAVDRYGHSYSTGTFKGNVDFGAGMGIFTMSDAYGGAYLLKTDQDGKFLWARRMTSYGSSATAIGYRTAITPDGDVVVSGQFSSGTTIDSGSSGTHTLSGLGGVDLFLLKYTSEGNLLWAKVISGPDNESLGGTCIDQAGNILVSGFFKRTVDFDPGPGVYNLSAKSIDAFVLKLDAGGNFVWARQMAGKTGASSIVNSLATDDAGNIYTLGNYSDTVDFDPGPGLALQYAAGFSDIFVQKMDASGRLIWIKTIGGPAVEDAYSLCVDKTNHLFFTGRFSGTLDFDPGPGKQDLVCTPPAAPGYPDIFVAKMDSSGRLRWARSMGGSYSDWGKSIVPDNAGSIYLCGVFANTVDFDPGPGVFNLSAPDVGVADAFVCKFDTAGKFAWAGAISGRETQQAQAIATNGLGLVYITGGFQFTVDFNPGSGTYDLTANSTDIFLQQLGTCTLKAKVLRDGDMLFQKNKTLSYQWVICPSYTPIIGANSQNYTPVTDGSYAVIISDGGCTDTSDCLSMTLGIHDPAGVPLQLLPNPATNTIQLSSGIPLQEAVLHLLDATGRVVYEREQLYGTQWDVDISSLSPGIYFVQLLSSGKLFTVQKLLKY